MDSSTKEERSEAQNDIFILPDYIFSLILSKLSRRDILNAKLVSRSFYNIIHENYHLLDRRKVCDVSIEYNKRYRRHPFRLKMIFRNVRDENSHAIQYRYNEKSAYFECDQDLSRFLKMSDMRDLDYLHVSGSGTKTGVLSISKLSNKDCTSFRKFIRKFSSVKEIVIRHICAPSIGAEDVYSLLSSLSSLNTIEYIKIFKCHNTMILSADFVVNLIKNNPNIMYLDIGSSNLEFSESVLKEFFRMEQPRIMENEYNNNEITLALYFGGGVKQLHDILRKDLSKMENVMKEVISNVLFPEEYKIYVSKLDFQDYEDTYQRLDSLT